MIKKLKIIGFIFPLFLIAQNFYIPMDLEQTDHLKAYGVVYRMLQNGYSVNWLLNYRGGSFIIEDYDEASKDAAINGVKGFNIDEINKAHLIDETEKNNSKNILLEKAPKIAVYSPKDKQPWDDAVTLALEYAGVEYDVIYDMEILNGDLYKYEWLHLHHEDFTGQFDRFYISAFNEKWFREMYNSAVLLSKELGYDKYWKMKRDVAYEIAAYVKKGGFLFAMCSATNSLDIAIALKHQDIIPTILDGDGTEMPVLDYSNTFAFENFKINETPTLNLADINFQPANRDEWEGRKFLLNDYIASIDFVEAMLTQNHTKYIGEFLGRTTSFDKSRIKRNIVILADAAYNEYAKYIHGSYGEGHFTFLAGHDPEDYVHFVNDPPTDLSYHKNSPGYRLILNNILFPASREKKKQT